MNTVPKIIWCLVAVLAVSLISFSPSKAHPPWGPKQVDCTDVDPANHDNLQEEVDEADPGQTIQILGTCKQTVVIRVPNLVLDGLDTGIIDGTGTTGDLVQVRASGVTIKNLTIRNANRAGLSVGQSASATIQGDTIEHNGFDGIFVDGSSHAFIGGSTDHNTPGTQGNTIQWNDHNGINVRENGSADIFHNVITHNGNAAGNQRGVNVRLGGVADISGNQITDNQDDGINVNDNASARLSSDPDHSEGNIITGNGRFGIQCSNEGYVVGLYSSGSPQNEAHASGSCGGFHLDEL